jgi:hypothetical protein
VLVVKAVPELETIEYVAVKAWVMGLVPLQAR